MVGFIRSMYAFVCFIYGAIISHNQSIDGVFDPATFLYINDIHWEYST